MSDSITRALLFVRQGRYREAESYLRKAIQNDPDDPQGFFFLATCLMHDPNSRSEALSMIDQALRLRPTRAFLPTQLYAGPLPDVTDSYWILSSGSCLANGFQLLNPCRSLMSAKTRSAGAAITALRDKANDFGFKAA